MINSTLIIVDAQNDFCVPDSPLYVKNSFNDVNNIIKFIKNYDNIKNIIYSLDTHHIDSVFFPIFWKDHKNNYIKPFTLIKYEDILNKKYVINPKFNMYTEEVYDYIKNLSELMVWPYHCILGTKGQCLKDELTHQLMDILLNKDNSIKVDYIIKGLDRLHETYSAFEEYDIESKTYKLKKDILKGVLESDEILICGEALSHCVKETILSIIKYKKEKNELNFDNIVLMINCTSSVEGFEKETQKFLDYIFELGIKIM